MEQWRKELYSDYLAHHGVMGMHWGIRRYQSYSTVPRGSGKGGKEIGEAKIAKQKAKKAKNQQKLAKQKSKRSYQRAMARHLKGKTPSTPMQKMAINKSTRAEMKIAKAENKIAKYNKQSSKQIYNELNSIVKGSKDPDDAFRDSEKVKAILVSKMSQPQKVKYKNAYDTLKSTFSDNEKYEILLEKKALEIGVKEAKEAGTYKKGDPPFWHVEDYHYDMAEDILRKSNKKLYQASEQYNNARYDIEDIARELVDSHLNQKYMNKSLTGGTYTMNQNIEYNLSNLYKPKK